MKNRKCVICNPTAGKIIFMCLLAATGVLTPLVIIWLTITLIIHFTKHGGGSNVQTL